MTTIAYFAGCAASLLSFGRLSNHFGRRPMAALATLLVLAVLMLLSQLESLAALYIARLLQGFASGLTASAVITWIVESIPAVYAKSSAVSAAIVGGGPSIGFAVGALLTGIWVESLKMPLQWLILSLGMAAVLTLPAIFLSAETAHCRPIPLKDLLMPALKLPKRIRPIFLPFMAAVIGGWALGAFAQAFSAPLAETLLGHDDRLAAAAVFVGFIAPFAWGGFLLRGSALRALQYSLPLVLAAMTLAIGAFVCQNFLGFVLSWAGCGLFSGIGAAAAMKIGMADIHADERAEMLALIYAVGYAASAIFGFMASVLANYVTLWQLLCAVFIWILSLTSISLTSKHLRQYAAMVESGALHRKAGTAD